MKQVKFNEKEYQIPESWEEITVQMVILADEYSDLLPEAPIIAIISAYVGIPITELKVSKLPEVNEILNIMSFINAEYVPTPKNSFEYLGKVYRCYDDITEQEFQDWVSAQTCLYNNKENPLKALPRLIAIMFKQEGESLDTVDLNSRAELFNGLPLTTAKDLECFFLHNLLAYKQITELYSSIPVMERQVQDKLNELQGILSKRKAESGGSLRTKFLIGYYQIYLKYLKSLWEKSSNTRSSKV